MNSVKDKKMNNKSSIITSLAVSILMITQNAHADFRKALDAYQNRDGATMLKEVKDAVDKKNDDGLMLLLMATNMDAATSDYDETTKQSKSTLRAILPQPKWDEMRELLVQATNNSTVDTQYFLNRESRQFNRELIVKQLQAEQVKRGEQPKKEYTNQELNIAYETLDKLYQAKGMILHSSGIVELAESGDPYYQESLGLAYLGKWQLCEPPVHPNNTQICQSKDETKGYYWLKRAAKTYERDGLLNEGTGSYVTKMCNLFYRKSNNELKDLRQAYLWCFMGANLGDGESVVLLREMQKSGSLKLINPKLYTDLDTAKWHELLFVRNIKEWPGWILEARKGLGKEDLPVFSFLLEDGYVYALDVYADGRVFIKDVPRSTRKDLLMKVTQEDVKRFLRDLKKIGIHNWPLYSGIGYPGEIIGESPLSKMRITLRDSNAAVRRLYVRVHRNNVQYPSADEVKLAKVKVLVDKYFPTKQLRIELGNSEKIKQGLITRDKKWIDLAKKGEQK